MADTSIILMTYGIIALLMVIAGIGTILIGWRIFLSEQQSNPKQNEFEFWLLRAKVNSIGAIVILTGFCWGIVAGISLPKYESGGTVITQKMERLNSKVEELMAQDFTVRQYVVRVDEAGVLGNIEAEWKARWNEEMRKVFRDLGKELKQNSETEDGFEPMMDGYWQLYGIDEKDFISVGEQDAKTGS
ncbi:MAG: hypothetical protein AAGK14_15740 [Verrucomicrobiota bacterium]